MNNQQISNKSIYGEYNKPEDRVTAALLQILHYGGHDLVTYLFEECGLPSNEINVQSQVYEEESRPDGMISCNCNYKIFIESKIVCNAVKTSQLNNHIKLVSGEGKWLIYITPDKVCPDNLVNLSRVLWMSWEQVVQKLRLYDGKDSLIEFLINQFILLYEHLVLHLYGDTINRERIIDDGIPQDQRVIIVGGRWAEDVALNYGFYACQPNRFFLPAKYMAFYFDHRIKYLFEIEGQPYESIDLWSALSPTSNYLSIKEPHYNGDTRKFFKLKLVKEFSPEITNDKKDKNNNLCAFTQKQKYTTYNKIMRANNTSDL